MENPWDEIAIQYVLVVNHIARKRPVEAFKEECTLVSCVRVLPVVAYKTHSINRLFSRYFTTNSGWTLPALFSILRDLRDLASDVSYSSQLHASLMADVFFRQTNKQLKMARMGQQIWRRLPGLSANPSRIA